MPVRKGEVFAPWQFGLWTLAVVSALVAVL
jgi:hypothetical protein